MIEIPLTQGKAAIIDDQDIHLVEGRTWHAWRVEMKSGELWYAVSSATTRLPRLLMHRVILDPPPHLLTDHIDGNGLNNQRYNLRAATKAQQSMNSRATDYPGKTSRYKGVIWMTDKRMSAGGSWAAQINICGHPITRSAPSEVAAAAFYNELAMQHFGEFARLNDLPGQSIDVTTNQQRLLLSAAERRARIVTEPGSAVDVAARYGVSDGFVRACRRAARVEVP
jgi:hypothetical protein